MTHHVFESSHGRKLGITGHGEPLGTREDRKSVV